MGAEEEFNVACSFKKHGLDGFHKLWSNPSLCLPYCGHFGLRGFFITVQAIRFNSPLPSHAI